MSVSTFASHVQFVIQQTTPRLSLALHQLHKVGAMRSSFVKAHKPKIFKLLLEDLFTFTKRKGPHTIGGDPVKEQRNWRKLAEIDLALVFGEIVDNGLLIAWSDESGHIDHLGITTGECLHHILLTHAKPPFLGLITLWVTLVQKRKSVKLTTVQCEACRYQNP